ncbi:hypothetical protein BTA37_17685 [Priestia megaterium]|nr:hypothetical protein BTA37_17685 [Priestia megaterium]
MFQFIPPTLYNAPFIIILQLSKIKEKLHPFTMLSDKESVTKKRRSVGLRLFFLMRTHIKIDKKGNRDHIHHPMNFAMASCKQFNRCV